MYHAYQPGKASNKWMIVPTKILVLGNQSIGTILIPKTDFIPAAWAKEFTH